MNTYYEIGWQAKKETVDKVCEIVREKLALGADIQVTADSEFSKLGADSLDTVCPFFLFKLFMKHLHGICAMGIVVHNTAIMCSLVVGVSHAQLVSCTCDRCRICA